MKPTIPVIALALVFGACKQVNWHAQQIDGEKRILSAAEIRQKIVGTWFFDTQNEGRGNWIHVMIISSNGDFLVVRSNEAAHIEGTWRLQEPVELITNKSGRVIEERAIQNEGSILTITTKSPNYLIVNGKKESIGNQDHFPVMYVDDRELILAPGFSVGGRYRFTR